jgi:cell division protein FtsZ
MSMDHRKKLVTTINLSGISLANLDWRIKVIGIGGAGCDVVDLFEDDDEVKFVCIDTDPQALNRRTSLQKVQLGRSALGASPQPDQTVVEKANQDIRQALNGANMVVIVAGLGGDTGTRGSLLMAHAAKEMGMHTVGLFTKPFIFEDPERLAKADAGLSLMEAYFGSKSVMSNEALLRRLPDGLSPTELHASAIEAQKLTVAATLLIRELGDDDEAFKDID